MEVLRTGRYARVGFIRLPRTEAGLQSDETRQAYHTGWSD